MSFKVSAAFNTFLSRYEDNHLIVSKHSNYQEEMFKVREKHFGFQTPFIKVPTNAVVSYENNSYSITWKCAAPQIFRNQAVASL